MGPFPTRPWRRLAAPRLSSASPCPPLIQPRSRCCRAAGQGYGYTGQHRAEQGHRRQRPAAPRFPVHGYRQPAGMSGLVLMRSSFSRWTASTRALASAAGACLTPQVAHLDAARRQTWTTTDCKLVWSGPPSKSWQIRRSPVHQPKVLATSSPTAACPIADLGRANPQGGPSVLEQRTHSRMLL